MGYNDVAKQASMKYIKDKQQEIKIRYKKDEYEKMILPFIKESGLPVATYFKKAVLEKILADENKKREFKNTVEYVKSEIVKSITKILKEDCRQIILYGSCARGDFTADSDIDIAILTDSDRNQVKMYGPQIDEISTKIGVDTTAIVNFVCLPYLEFVEKKSWYPYFKNIEKDGIILYER